MSGIEEMMIFPKCKCEKPSYWYIKDVFCYVMGILYHADFINMNSMFRKGPSRILNIKRFIVQRRSENCIEYLTRIALFRCNSCGVELTRKSGEDFIILCDIVAKEWDRRHYMGGML